MRAPRAGHHRRLLLPVTVALATFALTACNSGNELTEGPGPTVLVVSDAFSQGNPDAQARLRALDTAIDGLRAETGSGWTGRQDDLSGYLAELSGGRFPGDDAESAIRDLMDGYGPALFGITSTALDLGTVSEPDVTGVSTVRATQVVDGVEVLDAQLVFTVDDPEDAPAVTAVRGRTFPGLDVQTDPAVAARRAVRVAEQLTGGDRAAEPRLVVLPEGLGTLVWEVAILGSREDAPSSAGDGRYFIDAQTADLVTYRPSSAEARTVARGLSPAQVRRVARAAAAAAADPNSVDVSGSSPTGEDLDAVGVRTNQGVALVDTTVPTYDDSSGDGAIVTFDAGGGEQLPGKLYVERGGGTVIRDPEAIAAHRFSRVVHDYYASLGRASWDGAGGTLLSTVNYSDNSYCNSFFNGSQMIYGNPCFDGDVPAELTEVDVDTAGHEITHGVIDTSAALVYSGQSGALNESFADYFGNVIGNGWNKSDSAAVFEGSCTGITSETSMCHPNPEGFSLRYMLNGADYDDYLRLLNPSFRYGQLTGYNADHGGVHLNSAIWNNALWSIRTRLAQIDGTSGNESPLALDFDKIVYAALTTQLSSGSGFLDARAAVERTAVDAGADPVILRTAKEVFDLNKICAGCADTGTINGAVVSSAPQTQIEPAVSGDRIAWVDLSVGNPGIGLPATSRPEGDASALASSPETTQVAFAGDATVTLDLPGLADRGRVVRYDADGTSTVLADTTFSGVLAGLAGSAEGAAWVDPGAGTISFVDPAGAVTTADLPDVGAAITSVATGSGLVAIGAEDGTVTTWQPGGGFEQLGAVAGAVYSLATHDGRVLAVDSEKTATLFAADGSSIVLSENAPSFGAALNGDYAVWSEAVGTLGGQIAEELGGVTDTDLYLYSLRTGTIYNLLSQTGQQGYPAVSGDRLVWQDTVLGNNDVFTAALPDGL